MLKNGLLFLTSLLFVFLLCEIALRTAGIMGEVEWNIKNVISVNDKILNYRLQPNSLTFSGSVVYQLNSGGYRDLERNYENEKGSYRVAVIGDSIAFGYKVSFEKTFSRRLENLLLGTIKDKKLEVLNISIPGINTIQESNLLIKEGSKYNPDMVIMLFSLNDAESGTSYNAPEKQCRIEIIKTPVPCFLKGFLKRSALLYFVKARLDNLFWLLNLDDDDDVFNSIRSDYFNMLYMKDFNWRNHIVSGFEIISEFAKNKNIPVILIIFPIMFDFDNYRWAWIHEKVAKEGEKNSFYVIDLLEEYRKYQVKQLRVERGDFVHPNSLGHNLAAVAVFRFLNKSGFLTTSR